MIQKDTANLTNVLKAMTEFELAVAELYRACSQTWLVDKEFWADMEKAEMKHAENINKMNRIVSEKPERFEMGHVLKPAAIQTSISGIKSNIQRLKKKELFQKNMLFIARDLEQSILESHYADIVRTNDVEFQALINQVLSDTVAHREWLNKKIREASS